MTGFDPTAPLRDTEQDEPEQFPDNVVPPEELTDPPTTPGVEPRDAGSAANDADDA